MKFARLISILFQVNNLGSRNGLPSTRYSTTAMRSPLFRTAENSSVAELYRRISPVGDPKTSVVPILDQWVEEGRLVDIEQLKAFILELRRYKRYSHALEISMWMTDKRYHKLIASDIAIRLDLISKVHGIEQVEKYFNSISQKLKGFKVYNAFLYCYRCAKSVEKAEAVMQKMKDLGYATGPSCYNSMLNLYYETGNIEKFDALLQEMEENNIVPDKFTISIQLIACSAVSDIEGMENIVKRMESDPKVVCDWITYSVAASGYTKIGLVDKALRMLKKTEASIGRKQREAYETLITKYAAIGMKDEVIRLWDLYKKQDKVYNNGYVSILTSLLKLDDFEMAEKIFDGWESQDLYYDIRIPNYLIGAYSKKGHLEKAETLVDRVISKGGRPNPWTWYYMAKVYIQNDQTRRGLEMMQKAIALSAPKWKPSSEILAACLEYLKGEGDMEQTEEFIKLLVDKDIISSDIHDKLLTSIQGEKPNLDGLGALLDGSSV